MAIDSSASPYSASSIRVLTFEEAVRRRPGMYFGLGRSDPRLVVAVVQCVASAPFIWELGAGVGRVAVEVLVEADLRFTLSFNGLPPGIDPDAPDSGGGSLIRQPWPLSAAAAVSTLTTVMVSTGGRRWEQHLIGTESVASPRDGGASDETRTRVTFDLDQSFFAAGTAIPRNAAELIADLGLKGESVDLSVCDLAITDLRSTS
jgi:DNA gyrase/topoisomerase IV subunit B